MDELDSRYTRISFRLQAYRINSVVHNVDMSVYAKYIWSLTFHALSYAYFFIRINLKAVKEFFLNFACFC
jgi:hypothetical protein